MRGSAGFLELFDRQIVDADDFDAVGDQVLRAGRGDANVILMKVGRSPQARVRRFEQDADVIRQIEGRELLGANSATRADFHNPRTSEQHLERQGHQNLALIAAGEADQQIRTHGTAARIRNARANSCR